MTTKLSCVESLSTDRFFCSRARKIRCDSTRPVCNNCVRRSNECQYDAVPKRRGPDKRPGTRQRSCKKRPSDGSAPPPPSKKKRPVMDHRPLQVISPTDVKAKEENAGAKYSSSMTDDAQLLTHLSLYSRANGTNGAHANGTNGTHHLPSKVHFLLPSSLPQSDRTPLL